MLGKIFNLIRKVQATVRSSSSAMSNAIFGGEEGQVLAVAALDNLPKPFFLFNLETKKISYLNEAAKKILGLDVPEFDPKDTLKKYYHFYDPQTGEELTSDMMPTARILRGEVIKDLELRLKSSAGEFHLKVFSAVLPKKSGQPDSVIFLYQDITALKKAEAQLIEAQMNLNKAVEVAQIGFWHYDVVSDHVNLSPILMQQFGIDPAKFNFTLTETFKSIHPDDQERVRAAITSAIEKQTSYGLSYRVVRPSGEIGWIEANGAGIYNRQGQILTFTGTTLDVTSEMKSREVMKIAKEAVDQERENFRSLFRQTPEMVCILSGPEHRFVFTNEAHVRVLGFDATGKTVREAQPDSIEIFQILDDVYRTGKTAELNEIAVTVGGRLRYFNLTYAAKRDLNHRIDGIMILGTEITSEVLGRDAQKLQGEALALALNDAPMAQVLEYQARMIERHMGDGIGVSFQLAPEVLELFGKEFVGDKAHVQTDLAQEGKVFWSAPISTARGVSLGTILLSQKNDRVLTPVEEDMVLVVAKTTALIIERHSVGFQRQLGMKALEESETELKFTLETARMGTWRVDFRDGGLVTLSPKAQEIFGSEFGYNLPGDAISNLIHPEDRQHATEVLTQTIEKGATYEDSYRIRKKNGEVRWVELRGRTRYTHDGSLMTLTGVVIDITERKRTEELLQLSKLEAERANDAKSQFLANMSHEIRTPLGAIMGFAGLLRDEAMSEEDRAEFISVIERNSQQLLRIIDDILDLSKVEAGLMLVEYMDFSLVELLQDFSALMEFKAREKGIVFTVRAMTLLPSVVNTDPTRLRQILMNVVGNAIKFTDRGSVELRVGFKNGYLDLEVQDTGRGISKEQEENLFRPFSQADASITRKYGGTGLGLVLTRKLAEVLGGHFVLKQSQVDIGSIFSVKVEASADMKIEMISALGFSGSPAKAKTGAGLLEGLKVLLVEDSPDNQALISRYLGKSGAKIDVASDGYEGYEKAQANEYDIVLMDVQMPVMDGLTTVRKLRSDGYTKAVIALTAHAMAEERDRCLDAGFTDFLSKPINRDELIETLKSHRAHLRS